MQRRHLGLAFLLALTLAVGTRANPPKSSKTIKPQVACNAMEGKTIPASDIGLPTNGAKITSAKLNKGWGDPLTPDYVPEFCDIRGEIAPLDPNAPPINFGVNIPTDWNGKSFQIGGNGMDGFVPLLSGLARDRAGSPQGPAFPPDSPYPITKGYATYGSDSGHGGAQGPWTFAGRGGANPPPLPPNAELAPPGTQGRGRGGAGGANANAWMANDESFKNFAYEQLKKTHDAAFAIITVMYGGKPGVNYFAGESQGGREGLMAVAHYPQDYDGVLASVGLAYFTGLVINPSIRVKEQLPPGAWVPPAKGAAIAKEILRICDGLDGLEDGVINNYYACNRKLDPTVTSDPLAHIRCADGKDTGDDCLSDAQMAVVNSFHAPMKFGFPMANGETDWPGWGTAAEGPMGWILTPMQPDPNRPQPPGMLSARTNNPDDDVFKKSLDELKDPIQGFSKYADAPVDWSAFFKGHTKLIMYTAASDYVSNPRTQMRVYETVVKRFGQKKVDKSVRYYVSPNVSHGSVGKSATTGKRLPQYVDLIAPLEAWVEQGKAPETMVQAVKSNQAPYAVERSKPLCRFPNYPRYNGSGDPDKAEGYTCSAP